ncbi:MAG TPA: hypothetical protein VIC84_23070 [Blastocatellia bacterium]|jgi:hypothetical protein
MIDQIKVHIHDNSKGPGSANCLGEFELERDKIITLHMHDGQCMLCPEGHCHHGSIGVVIGLNGDLMITFEGTRPPERVTFDDFKPIGRFLHQGGTTNDV